MASQKLTFHVPPEAGPDQILLLLQGLAQRPDQRFESGRDLLDAAMEWGVDNRSEIPALATAIGLLEKNKDTVGISGMGVRLAHLKPQIQPDLVHFLLYSGWSRDKPGEHAFLWSYQRVCDFLWRFSPLSVLQSMPLLVETTINDSQQVFGSVIGYESGSVSFSDKSIRGITKWLRQLLPPVIEADDFACRHFCPPELMLFAVGYVAQQTGGEIGIDLLLTPERRELFCRVCLLDATALDRTIDWMLPLFPNVIEAGTRTGSYGRFLRLRKWPALDDLSD